MTMWGQPPAVSLRNARGVRLRFRSVGAPYEPYPEWVRALVGQFGVYIIRLREARGPRIVYVGESSRQKDGARGLQLYATLTRHFQRWSPRRRGSPHRYSGHDPGLTYPRARCDAAAILTPANRAVEIQNALIAWLKPRDNIVGADPDRDDDDDEIPFSTDVHHDDAIPF